jgi:small subunit ribosomal protein S6
MDYVDEPKVSKYEMTFIVSTDITEDEREKAITKFRELVVSFKGDIHKEHTWGVRRMSYRIKGQDYGLYVTFLMNLPASKIEEVKEELNLDAQILRYLVISLDKEGIEFSDVSTFPENRSEMEAAQAAADAAPEAVQPEAEAELPTADEVVSNEAAEVLAEEPAAAEAPETPAEEA